MKMIRVRKLMEILGFAISDHLKKNGISERKVANDFKGWRKNRRQGRVRSLCL